MWAETESDSLGPGGGQDCVKTADGFLRRNQSWYVSSDVASDLHIRVGDVSFHLHKYPLLSRSGRMNRIIYESTRDADVSRLELDDLPGGAEAFELAAKFCYGIAVDLTASNISGLRCAAEYLEMTEDLEEGNLIFKTEAFLSYVVLSSWRDSIVVLKSCEGLSPWAENLQIVRRCSESIAWKACANPKGVRWAYTGRSSTGGGVDSKGSSPGRGHHQPSADWWFEDVSLLRIDHFVRVVTAIKVKGMRFDLIGASITHYASKWLPGLSEGRGVEETRVGLGGGLHMVVAGSYSREEVVGAQAREQRMVIESLISIIPPQRDSVTCSFLLRLLRLANVLKVAPALVTELEKRVGMQLEQAALSDLLVPSYGRGDTMYDVDLVQRLLEHFLVQEPTERQSPDRHHQQQQLGFDGGAPPPVGAAGQTNAKMRVARLIDSYLTEVSRDKCLSLTKFQVLAEALPESARSCDDGLYRAVDSYLKAHPMLTEHERKRLCRAMDCQKLSMDACVHAAQNERLPLRVVVQVLFSEQVKISNALKSGDAHFYQPMLPSRRQLLEATPLSFQEGWATAKKDINTLKFELESIKAKYLELQNDMDALQTQIHKLSAAAVPNKTSAATSSGWGSGWKKLGKLTKITSSSADAHGSTPPQSAVPVRKGQRRWRNSIS